MIDPTDKQTQPLALEQPKRGRGRPATGAAMTPAEKQKAYRQRLANKSNVTESSAATDKDMQYLADRLADALEEIRKLKAQVVELRKDNDGLIKVLDEASKEKKYWIDRALKKEAGSTKPRFELQYKNFKGRWVKGSYDAEIFSKELMTKEGADDLREIMQKESDKDPKGGLTWRIKELK